MTKVNPDMINQPMPKAIDIEPMGMPSLTPPGPSITPLSLGNLDAGPLKMLPDFDKDNDDMPGGEMDKDDSPVADIQKAMGDQDGDGDHDMKDHELEKKDDDHEAGETPDFEKGEEEEGDEEEKEEAWANEPDTEVKSVDYMNNQIAGGMNKPKQMTKHSYKQGDNPMAMESGDLRAHIRAELLHRLAEAKGAK